MTRSLPSQSRTLAWRWGAVLLFGVLAQAVVAPRLAPPGAAPDLLLLATAVSAAAVPSRSAVMFGFAAGLVADLFLITPLGLSAATFTAIARAGAAFPAPRRAVLVAPWAVLSALLAGAMVMVAAGALRAGPAPSATSIGLLLRASITAGALSPPVFAVLRRLVGPASGTLPAPRRGRAA
ncbi:MAG: rod shape-determining protein MreD [Actinomycetota bacterium]|nr:rod shape-determining protein MreD [Actinomycetota bacterium]